MMMLFFKRSEYDDDDVVDRKVKVLKMMLLIERSKCQRLLLIEAVKVLMLLKTED